MRSPAGEDEVAGNPHAKLSRRERQTMEIVYRLGEVTVNDVLANLEDPPSYSAMRACMRVLEEKGHLIHRQDGPRYVYLPTMSLNQARQSAIEGLLRNFFNNSYEQMIAALLDASESGPSSEELENLARLIEQARKEGR
jgi:predicted transcriptional regulator